MTLPQDSEPATQPNAAESTRKLAEKHGIDLATVTGSGSGGKILGKDVKAAIAAKDAAVAVNEPGPAAQAQPQPAPAPAPPIVEAPVTQPDPAPVPTPAPLTAPVNEPSTVVAPTPQPVQAPATAPAPQTAPDPVGSPEPTVTLRVPVTGTHKVSSFDDLSKLAADLLPNLMVVSVDLELTGGSVFVLAQVAQTVAVAL